MKDEILKKIDFHEWYENYMLPKVKKQTQKEFKKFIEDNFNEVKTLINEQKKETKKKYSKIFEESLNYEERLKEFQKEKDVIIKEELSEVCYLIYKEMQFFKDSSAPFNIQAYERFFNGIKKNQKKIVPYSSNEIKLVKIPLHPSILWYKLLLVFRISNPKYQFNDELEVIYKEIFEQVFPDKIAELPKFSKVNNYAYSNVICKLIEDEASAEQIELLIKTFLSFQKK